MSTFIWPSCVDREDSVIIDLLKQQLAASNAQVAQLTEQITQLKLSMQEMMASYSAQTEKIIMLTTLVAQQLPGASLIDPQLTPSEGIKTPSMGSNTSNNPVSKKRKVRSPGDKSPPSNDDILLIQHMDSVATPTVSIPVATPILSIPVATPAVPIPVAKPTMSIPVATPTVSIPVAKPTVSIPVAKPTVSIPVAKPTVSIPVAKPTVWIPVATPAPIPVATPAPRSKHGNPPPRSQHTPSPRLQHHTEAQLRSAPATTDQLPATTPINDQTAPMDTSEPMPTTTTSQDQTTPHIKQRPFPSEKLTPFYISDPRPWVPKSVMCYHFIASKELSP